MKNKELIEYIESSINQGKSKEEIYKDLLNQGLGVDLIQNAFNQVEHKHKKEGTQQKHLTDIYKKTIIVIVTTGAILIGFGLFSLIAISWRYMPEISRLLIILGGIISSYTSGWFLKAKWHYEKTGEALILLGALIYGIGIFLVAQMFEIKGNWPDGFILWMIGNIVMAFALNSTTLFYLSILVGIVPIVSYALFIIIKKNIPLITSSFLLLIGTILTFLTALIMKKGIKTKLND